jgi:undecaprenyl-phosphate 4-deoxy-4-formamido-L-arabinose transferase
VSEVANPVPLAGLHTVSVVIPVYQGARTLPALLKEIEPLTSPFRTPDGHSMRISEVLLSYDHGPDGSAEVIRELAGQYDFVRLIWLSRNFGQHAATLAGMASSGGDWIATMDEDGQHDPAELAAFLDAAVARQAAVVYGDPVNTAPHGPVRNAGSRLTKRILARLLSRDDMSLFQSYRLVLGEIGRSVAAYAGAGVFLDVAMSWVNDRTAVVPIRLRAENSRPSGYTMRRLLSHFWRMILTSGTRGLRLVSALGAAFAVVGVLLAIYVVIARLFNLVSVQGWASVMVAVLLGTGAILFALGVIAEYIGVAVNMAMGKPLYLIVSDPADSPLSRRPSPPHE